MLPLILISESNKGQNFFQSIVKKSVSPSAYNIYLRFRGIAGNSGFTIQVNQALDKQSF